MTRQSGIYSTPEKYTQPRENSIKIAEYNHMYTATFKKIYHNFYKHINISKNISTIFFKHGQIFSVQHLENIYEHSHQSATESANDVITSDGSRET
jgi:hypothetical protein